MYRYIRRRVALIATALPALLGACADAPSAPAAARPVVTAAVAAADGEGPEGKFRRSDTGIFLLWLPCQIDGRPQEAVRVTASFDVHGRRYYEADGRLRIQRIERIEGSGVGISSGRRYALKMRDQENTSLLLTEEWELGRSTVHWRAAARLTDLETGAHYRLSWLTRLVAKPNGEIVIDRMEEQASCE